MTANRRTRRIAKSMKRVALPLARAQLRQGVRAALRRFDRELAQRVVADAHVGTISCSAGCAACCERVVMLTWAEADLLVATHLDVVREVLPELDRHNALLGALGARSGAHTGQDGAASDAQAALETRWFQERVACAFLDPADKRCRVYENRPLACRAHLVGSPPAACAVRPGEHVPDLALSEPLAHGPEHPTAQLAVMTATSEALGGPVLMGLLPSLVPRVFRERLDTSATLGV